MTKRLDVRRPGFLVLALLLLAAAWPCQAQDSVSPELFRIDTWNVLVMDQSYLFLRDPGTGSSGLDVLAGVRLPEEPGYLRFLVFEDTDPGLALSRLSDDGLLGNTDYEKAKEILAGQGYDASGKEGKLRDLTAADLEKLESDSGTTTLDKDFIAEAVKSLSAQAQEGPVFAKASDCSFLSGVLYFAEQSRQAAEKPAASPAKAVGATSGALSSLILTQVCNMRPPGVPASPAPAVPALPSPLPATVPRPPGPITPPVWMHDSCTGHEGDQATCLSPTWETCLCSCEPDRVGGATWRKRPSSCTGPTPWPLGPPATPCSPPGGYAWCAPGQICICGGTPPVFAPPPPPPPPTPTPAPTTPPAPTGSGEIAAAFLGLTLLAAWFVRRRARA